MHRQLEVKDGCFNQPDFRRNPQGEEKLRKNYSAYGKKDFCLDQEYKHRPYMLGFVPTENRNMGKSATTEKSKKREKHFASGRFKNVGPTCQDLHFPSELDL